MPRAAPSRFVRLIALAPPLAAGLALVGVALAAALALGLVAAPPAVSLDVPGLAGGLAFGLDAARAGPLAAMLLAGAACMLAVPSLAGAALIVAGTAGIAAGNDYTLAFAALVALVLARHARAAEAVALAVLPVILLAVAQASGLRALLVLAGAVCFAGSGFVAAVTLDLAVFGRAAAAFLAGLALIAAGLGDMAAARLAVETAALAAPAIALAAGVIDEATGTRSPDWLGGLARGMPRFSLAFFGALALFSLLPPGSGFAAFRATFGSALGAGGWVGGLAAVALGLGFAFGGFAAIRAFGLVCLGRPRSLRAAAAEDIGGRVLLGLAFPVAGGFVLALGAAPFALLVPAAILLALHRFAIRTGPVEVPPFEDGFAKPPAWLPFGDPATQINASGFAAPLRLLAARLPSRAQLRRAR